VRSPAAAVGESGATLRVADVVEVLRGTGYDVHLTTRDDLGAADGPWDVGVAVSYVCAPALRILRRTCARTWLDVVDSWVQVDVSGVRAGQVSYAARAVRDAYRLSRSPRADLVTWISGADRASDRWAVPGTDRLVLPGRPSGQPVTERSGRRLVLAGDWTYPPNRTGLRWFARRVLPHLPEPVHVFGRGPVPQTAGLRVHGHVDDPSLLLGTGDVHLAPVPFGGGVKRKVLQPLLAGLPVVTTPAGARGLRSHPLLSVADRPDGFAAAVRRWLEQDPPEVVVRPEEVHDADDTGLVRAWLAQAPPWRATRENSAS
jgi:hypothetical protein